MGAWDRTLQDARPDVSGCVRMISHWFSVAYAVFALVVAAGNAYLGNWWFVVGCLGAAAFWGAAAVGLLDRKWGSR